MDESTLPLKRQLNEVIAIFLDQYGWYRYANGICVYAFRVRAQHYQAHHRKYIHRWFYIIMNQKHT
jgi:hypothetical protein